MPITTSVITGTVAHKHSATGGSGDGGKLATGGLGGDTSFNLSNGSIMYSNGTSLDELIVGGSGTTLTVSGGLPAWSTGSGAYSLLGSQRLTADASTLSVSFAAQTGDTTGSVVCYYNLLSLAASPYTQTEITVNNISGGSPSYTTQFCRMTSGGGNFTSDSGTNHILLPTGQRVTSGSIEFTSSTPQQVATGDTAIGYNGCDRGESAGRGFTTYGGTLAAGITDLTEITSVELNATSGNWGIGSQMSVFASKI
jgi:hypothetical protein